LGEYQDIINRFVDGQVGVVEFESGYLRVFKQESTIRADAEYEILNDLFHAVDADCDNPVPVIPVSSTTGRFT
jgi:hypothetical protein